MPIGWKVFSLCIHLYSFGSARPWSWKRCKPCWYRSCWIDLFHLIFQRFFQDFFVTTTVPIWLVMQFHSSSSCIGFAAELTLCQVTQIEGFAWSLHQFDFLISDHDERILNNHVAHFAPSSVALHCASCLCSQGLGLPRPSIHMYKGPCNIYGNTGPVNWLRDRL